LILENTCSFISVEIAYRFTNFSPVHFERTLTQHIGFTMNNTLFVVDSGNLILIVVKIQIDTISKFAYTVIPAQSQLNPSVFNYTAVCIRWVGSEACQNRRYD